MARRILSRRPRNVLQPTLRVIAEAGWIAVVYSAVSVKIDQHVPILGPVDFFLLVLSGVLVGRYGRTRLDLGPVVLVGSVVVGGIVGWLASPEVRTALPNVAEGAGL